MRIYQVGGSVRDELLGLPVHDRDWVVVGASPDELIALGYQPVGKDFPVFLHPETREEYALARTERKTAPGYRGFTFHAAPDVTLDEDLRRRDLTINAIAKDKQGALIDPFNGRDDLHARCFRHVSDAFSEDPVRILRVARFAARFADFAVAPETMMLMRSMVEAGEVDALVPERVWQELARGLMERRPTRMLLTLHACGALAKLLPEIDALFGKASAPATVGLPRSLESVDIAAHLDYPLDVRFALMMLDCAAHNVVRALCERLRVPTDVRDLAVIAVRHLHKLEAIESASAQAVVEVIEHCDALRKPDRFGRLLDVGDARLRAPGAPDRPSMFPRDRWLLAMNAARAVDAGAIAKPLAEQPDRINGAVRHARVEAVRRALEAR